MIDLTGKRLISLDTETTGLETSEGHRIIEIGCVEILNRQITGSEYQQYIQPKRLVSDSFKIHGISDNFLQDKPLFSDISQDFINYISGCVLIIHNAKFDVGFLNNEFSLMKLKTRIEDICTVVDTIHISKEINPRAQHSLNALARKHHIDLSARELHGALLDAQILAQVYLAMTGGQTMLFTDMDDKDNSQNKQLLLKRPINNNRERLAIIFPDEQELSLHQHYFD